MSVRSPSQHEHRILIGIFVVTVLTHAWLATRNWTAGFMPGHEFRQSQTAFVSHFIDRENDFSLLYESPIVGKPWVSILLEVPIYEWSVVLLSRATGWPHVVAARTVSLGCFYLMLPALWLLLGWLGVGRARRLLPLSLVLLCPVYIFYSRAFLMESMELMCCAWFLYGYLRMMEVRRWPWFVLATVAGTGASLIKSATFAIWLVPAAAYAAWHLWRDLRGRAGVGAVLQSVFWGLAGVTVPLGLLRLWIMLTDPIKAAHASAWIFTSGNLSLGNWGFNDLFARFSGEIWGTLFARWSEALMPPWLVWVALVAALVWLPAERRRVAGLAAVFFLAQLLFPFAYAYQEYYYYACAVFLLGAFGLALQGLLDTRLPRGLCWLLMAILPAAQLHTYWRVYYPQQMVDATGDFSFTAALRELTQPGSVIVVSGADWAAMVPLYSQRRALMIRNGLGTDRAYLERAMNELGDEDVSALVLLHDERRNTLVRDLAVQHFDLEPQPTFSHPIADVYCSRRSNGRMKAGLKERNNYGDLKVTNPEGMPHDNQAFLRINAGLARSTLPRVSPAPIRGRFAYHMGLLPYDGEQVMNAHPDSDLWLHPPAQATRIEWDFGMVSSAWEKAGDKSDGVEMTIHGERPGVGTREIYRRELDPVNRPADRGKQREVIPYQPLPGELLHFYTGPRGGRAYDWTYWARIEVK